MTKEEAILCLKGIKNYGRDTFTEQSDWQESLDMAIEALEQEPTTKIEESNFSQEQYKADIQSAYDCGKSVLDKLRAEIKEKIEQEEFARSVFRHEEKDTAKAEQCTGSIMAYNNLIKLIDKYKAESEDNK